MTGHLIITGTERRTNGGVLAHSLLIVDAELVQSPPLSPQECEHRNTTSTVIDKRISRYVVT